MRSSRLGHVNEDIFALITMISNLQAFFSCTVNSLHEPFIRSLRLIHKSACSLGGIPSHLFSMSARVTLETACEALRDCTAVTARRVDDGEAETASLDARRTEVRSIVKRVIGIYKKERKMSGD